MERKTKVLLGMTSETFSLLSLLTWDVTTGTGLSAASQGSTTSPSTAPSSPHPRRSKAPQTSRWPNDLSEPGEVSVRAGSEEQGDLCEGLNVSEGRDHRQDVFVIIMAPAEMSVVQSFCSITPSLCGTKFDMFLTWLRWNVWSVLRKWDRTGRWGRLWRQPSKNPLLS